MSFNNLFGNQSHSRTNIHNDQVKSNLGTKLNNVRDRRHTQKEIPIFDVGNSVIYQPVSTYGASLLDTVSIADLRTQILETNEEAMRIIPSDGNNEINFYTGGTGASNLKLQIKDSSIEVKNGASLTTFDVTVDPNRSFIASYVGSDTGNNLNLRYGASVYQQFNASGIEINQNVVMATNKFLKMKVENNDATTIIESTGKRQLCLYSYEGGSNSGFLVQADANDILAINNYKNSIAAYRPICINRSDTTYVVMGASINPTSISSANFVSNGQSVFCNGASPLLHISSSNIKPYTSIIPSGINSEDLGNATNYFGEGHINNLDIKSHVFMDFFGSTNIRNNGFYFRSGFSSGSGIQDNMSFRSHNASGANDGLMISAYGGVSLNCGMISVSNDNGLDGATNRAMLINTAINNHVNMLPNQDGTLNIGSTLLKFSNLYANNVRAHTSLYTDNIRPYSTSPIHFHNTNVTFDANQNISVDNLFSSATNRDLYLGNGPSAIKMAFRNAGNIEVSSDLNPSFDQAADLGAANNRYAQIHGMTLNAAVQVKTNQIQPYTGSDVIIDGNIRPSQDNTTMSCGTQSYRWTEVWAFDGTINTSDRNNKKDITPIKNALNWIRKLKPVSYVWKDKGKRKHTGFIAQEVLEASPFGTDWGGYIDTNGYGLGLRYNEFVSVNTQAIKELDAKVSRLASGISGETKVDLNYHTDSSEIIERIEALESKKQLETVVEEYDDSELKQQIKQLQIDNHKQESCINDLITENQNLSEENKQIKNKLDLLYEQVQKLLEDKPNVEMKIIDDSDMLLSETGDNDHMELVEQRLHTLETKLTKVENKQKKITTIVNKLNKA